MVRSFQELIVWQRSLDLAEAIYLLTRAFPKDELSGLTAQLRRASVSVSSNIAEGQSRITKGEFVHFLSIARGSNAEVASQLILARRLHLGDEALITRAESFTTEVSKMLTALISTLKVSPPRKPQPLTTNH